MDSSGLGAIVGLYVSAKRQGCALRLINLNQRLKELFRITKLAKIFEGHMKTCSATRRISEPQNQQVSTLYMCLQPSCGLCFFPG